MTGLPAILRRRATDMHHRAERAQADDHKETALALYLIAHEFWELAREIERENP